MATGETGKQRSQRIQIDYYRHRGRIFWWRWACIAAGLAGAVAYAALVISPGGSPHLSTGTLSIAHASFEKDCQQCHQDFTPLSADAFRLDPSATIQHAKQACNSCHPVGDHHRTTLLPRWQSFEQDCAQCHREHLGRANELTAIGNDTCNQCHANLSSVCSSSYTLSVRDDITHFDLDRHGEFQSLKSDRGRVLFDHHQHMLPGQVDAGVKGAFTIGMLEALRRDSYRDPGQGDADLVTLNCGDCHQPAGNPDSQWSLSSDAELGRYMKPISFQQHCSACHSMNPPGRGEDTLPLPHAAPWSEMRLLLTAKISGGRAEGSARTPRENRRQTPQVGEGFGVPAASANVISAAEIDAAIQDVRVQCLKCHDADSITEESIAAALSGKSAPLIPGRWLRHGLFDHAAHREVDCRFCHGAAYPSEEVSTSPATDHQQVMVGGIDTCTPCHRTIDTQPTDNPLFGKQPVWASDACVLCHRYHTSTEAQP